MGDVFVYLIDLPSHVSEMVVPCYEGYTIYIDANLSTERQQQSYFHALRHIANGDFYKDDVQFVEWEAHK